MIGDAGTRMTLRSVAIAIALAAVIDPSITSKRATKPDVVVLASDSVRDGTLANEVARSISKTYTVTRGALAGASATIVAGRTLPADAMPETTPVFAVMPATDRPSLTIESLRVPTSAPALARVRVDASIHVTGARGKTADVTLRDAAVSLDHTTRSIATNDDTLRVTLSFVPPSTGPTRLRVAAHVDGASDAVGDALVNVRDQKWAILFYDPRPSWMSTFVRRAIERDPRFVATSRVVTSRDVATSVGNPPGRLDDLSALELFDEVVVGAPQALSATDVAALEAFMRRRGGSVVLLLDDPAPALVHRLIGVFSWMRFALPGNQLMSSPMDGNDSLALQSTERIEPSTLPPGAVPIAGGAQPVVWREPVGAGTLVISTALDAWRFRDPALSSFDRFWQTVLGDAANRAAEPLTVSTSSAVVAPGERFDVNATLRDEAIDGQTRDVGPLQVAATVGARPDSSGVLHLWPRGAGQLAGRVHAPASPGLYQVALSVAGRRAAVPFVVASDGRPVVPAAEARLVDLVHATHGAIVSASQIARLGALLGLAVHVAPRLVTWHPMRSAWWIIPFVLALSGEWWLRRRRGFP
jgi:hypothetical protein